MVYEASTWYWKSPPSTTEIIEHTDMTQGSGKPWIVAEPNSGDLFAVIHASRFKGSSNTVTDFYSVCECMYKPFHLRFNIIFLEKWYNILIYLFSDYIPPPCASSVPIACELKIYVLLDLYANVKL